MALESNDAQRDAQRSSWGIGPALTRCRHPHTVDIVRLACLILLVPAVFFALDDVRMASDDQGLLAVLSAFRFVLIGTLAVGVGVLSRVSSVLRRQDTILVLTSLIALCVIGLNFSRPRIEGLPLAAPLMWLLGLYVGFPNTPRRQLVAPLLLTVGLIALPAFWTPSHASLSNVLVLTIVNALGGVFVFYSHRHVIPTKGEPSAAFPPIISICSICRRLRSDPGEWELVESYIRARAGSQFSHGLCSTCFSEHYGESTG